MSFQRGVCVCGHSKDDLIEVLGAVTHPTVERPAHLAGWQSGFHGEERMVEDDVRLTIEEEHDLIAAGTSPDWERDILVTATEILRKRLREVRRQGTL